MEKALPLFATHLCIRIAQNEANGGEEVTFSGAIATDNHIGLWGKRFDYSLVLVAMGSISNEPDCWVNARAAMMSIHIPFKALDDDLLDIHV